MFKQVFSALAITGVMLSGAAFAAEPTATTAGQSTAPAQVQAQVASGAMATKSAALDKKTHHKVTVHKQAKAAANKSEPAASPNPAKSN